MKDGQPGSGYELQRSPNLRYVLAMVSAFSALTGGLTLVQQTLASGNYGFFVVELLVIMLLGALCIWLLIPGFWQKKRQELAALNFRPDGKSFYGYEAQEKVFQQVLSAAKEVSEKGDGPPLVVVFGKSGVGKSSFLMHCFSDPKKVIRLDLRQGLTRLTKALEATFGLSPPDMAGTQGIKKWLEDNLGSPLVKRRLSETVLIIDQFEQVIANKETLSISVSLFQTLARHCVTVIICVRTDVLGHAADGIREFLPDPVDVSRKVRLFELEPIQHDDSGDSAEAEEALLCGVWNDIFTDSSDPNVPLLRHLGELLRREEESRGILPVFVKLAVYALQAEEIQTVPELQAKTSGKISALADNLFRKMIESTANEQLALRILFCLSNDTGVSEQFGAQDLQRICATGAELKEVKELLEQLSDAGAVIDVGSGRYTLSHEYLGELAQRRVPKSMAPSERMQMQARQSLVKNWDSRVSFPQLCDVKERVRLLGYEGLILLTGLLIGISRLFFWSPQAGVRVGLNPEFAPAALGWLGTSFFFWLFYGNVGKATIPYQGGAGRSLWKLTSLGPLVGWAICCFFPRVWLVAGSGVTIVAATTHLAVSRRARKSESKDVAAIFKGFSTTTFGLILIFLVSYGMLCLISDPWYHYAALATACVSLVGLVRSGVYMWHGRQLRNLLARIDLDIPLRRAEQSRGERG
jgi:hypothetical protein